MNWLAFSAMGFGLIAIMIVIQPAESAIPPTRAFTYISSHGLTYTAPRYDSTIYLDYSDYNVTSRSNGVHMGLARLPYAQLSSTSTQQCALNGAASNITLNTNDSIYGMTHSTTLNNHQIRIDSAGVYFVMAVPQVGEAAGQASGDENFWLVINGANVANSNIKTTVMTQQSGPETMTGSMQWVGYLAKNDVVSFQQSCDDSDIGIIFTASATPPTTPSVIISIMKIS